VKLREIFRFELAYQGRRPWPWLVAGVLLVLAFLVTRDAALADALYEEFYVNSPFAVAKTTVVGSLIWLLVGGAVAGDAAARDVATGMHPLLWTVRVSRAEYLGGRFLAALTVNALVLLAVQAGAVLAVYAPGVDPAVIGPFRPAAWLSAYGYVALPTAFAATAIQFWLATRSGRPMASYAGSLLLFFMAYVVGIFLFVQGRRELANLLDPIGVHFVLSDLSHLWTPIERNTRLLALEGTLLANRLLWLGVGVAALAVTYARFRFAHRAGTARWRPWRGRGVEAGHPARAPGAAGPSAGIGVATARPGPVPDAPRAAGSRLGWRQTLAIAGASFRAIAASWAGLAILVAIPVLTVPVIVDQMVSGGVPLVPTTALVLTELTAPLSAELSRWVIVPLLLVFLAGELVWREREAGLGEIADALPGSEWPPFLGRLLGLALVLVAFLALLMAAGMLAQAAMGYRGFEIGLYLAVLFGLQLPEYLLFALLALVVHVAVDQKYIGHLVAVVAYVVIALAPMFGLEHDLLVYGAGPAWSYTEMRGFGPTLGPWAWFRLYWAAWALLLAVAARILWVRGVETGLRERLRLARLRLRGSTSGAAALATVLILGFGGFVFYNTNVLNEYRSSSDRDAAAARYERLYGGYAEIPQPALRRADLRVEIFPELRTVRIDGRYGLVNESGFAVDSIHVATVPGIETGDLTLDRPVSSVLVDEELGHRIYELQEPLRPGDSVRLDFRVRVEPRGFRESGVDPALAANGTSFTSEWLPAIGYQRSRELVTAADRREHELAARPLIPSLQDARARNGRAGGVAFGAVIGTDMDQVAVAPGALRETWTEAGRRYFRYSTSAPIGHEWAFLSAEYAVRETRWKDPDGAGREVAIRVYHHPGHTEHVDGLVRSVRASLDYYTRHFGPYPYNSLTVAERPGNGMGMHADAAMITHSEGAARWSPDDDPGSLDLPFAVAAHEVAHQWTVPYAFAEGAPIMSESIAWYYGIKAVEHTRGVEQRRALMRFMRGPYPYQPIRRGEPLLRGLDPYLAYRKGPFALYALSEYIGESRVNAALKRLVEKHRPEGAPLATTLDLHAELGAATPDSLRYLLHDLFEVNTFWELETERATAEPTDQDGWRVTLDVRARKVAVDSAGAETDIPMDEAVQIGVFARAEGGGELSEPLYVAMHRIRSGDQTITVTVPRRPALAGIDPFHLLDWEERGDDDNIEPVRTER
jgi:ABC-2 type transport system permease protein